MIPNAVDVRAIERARLEGSPPTIVTSAAVGGIPEIVVEGETGLLVPRQDDEALADALAGLLADPELRRRMGPAGRERAERLFDVARLRRDHLELYDRLLAP